MCGVLGGLGTTVFVCRFLVDRPKQGALPHSALESRESEHMIGGGAAFTVCSGSAESSWWCLARGRKAVDYRDGKPWRDWRARRDFANARRQLQLDAQRRRVALSKFRSASIGLKTDASSQAGKPTLCRAQLRSRNTVQDPRTTSTWRPRSQHITPRTSPPRTPLPPATCRPAPHRRHD